MIALWAFIILTFDTNMIQVGPFESLALCDKARMAIDRDFDAKARHVHISSCFQVTK